MGKTLKVDPKLWNFADILHQDGTMGRQIENAIAGFLGLSGIKVLRKDLASGKGISEACDGTIDGILGQAIYENIQFRYCGG